jgi:DNA polymerase III delta prime subunit
MAGVLEQLIKSADKGRLPHAILLWGPMPQKEKTTLAIELSRHLMGLRRKLSKRDFHRQAVDGLLIDFKMMRPDEKLSKDAIVVDQIDKLDEELALYPFESVNRIIYIPNATLMTPQAQNSLLKKLEEPPANNYLILDVQKPRTLLRTILSRCLVLYLSKTENAAQIEFEDYLHSLSNSETAKNYLLKIEAVLNDGDSKGATFLSDIRHLLSDQTPLSDEEKILICAYALKEKRPEAAREMLLLNDNPQKMSLDACYYHIAHTMVN